MHLWLGLGVGLYIAVICVSGSLIVPRRDYDRVLCPKIIMVSGLGHRLTDSQLRARVKDAYPDTDPGQVEIRGPRLPGAAIEVWIRGRTYRIERLFDPYTGSNLDDIVACEPRFVSLLADFHDNLTAGRAGLLANGAGAIAILLMCATGSILWWPGRKRWRHG
ncbi:MAG TPA: PepSY-associated TM helix domain-containing protein, partial [Steroidobacteraceae bacterium]|nr:PepSY-associated TM helix domain-containing protein [Steroidobacteraceae bacterium]